MSSTNANNKTELMSALIEIRCSVHLLRKYAPLDEAFKISKSKYYIQVRESVIGKQFSLDLYKEDYNHNL